MKNSVYYIINPAGQGGGGGIRAWNELKALWPEQIDPKNTIFTERPGHAQEIAAQCEGYETLVAVGGDGTVGEILSGIMERDKTRPRLAIIPGGTGNDVARNAGICSVRDGVFALQNGRSRSFDLIRVDCMFDGKPIQKHAFLFVAVGFSSNPMTKRWMKRLFGPKLSYYLGTFLQSIIYQAPHMTLRTESREFSKRTWMIIVGNADRAAGGSMCLSPGARTDDGELNVTVIPFQSKLKMVTGLLPKIASGAHIYEAGISYYQEKKIYVDSNPVAILDLDGDILGETPATFTVCPQAVQIMTPEW
ncbi:MAG: diacylglycerol kinase family lipid kinase [Desulfobacterium sp.]|nr:diacylglycerol kinase family lipid kinase [Desulfobacterium sp.]MBU3947353.1 diacylglycerol kinase family lipid kinase [Pseudomonadota bacterium]MBU4011308.1 diacylglycerol kinase family lipid kinase [Pseudomonadota bacterium]MBU4036390.1 diacylglycerol kinase family lipid kinase [Pseudomonadota bacterium]